MQDYYEQLWERLPDELHPPDLDLRRAFCLGGVRPGLRVLDLGCGEGDIAAALAGAGAAVVGVEVARAALERARRRHPDLDDLRLVELDGPLPLDDGEVGRVVASEVIEHVADTEGWLREIHRVLAPGGELRITTPDHGRLRLLLGGIERYSEPLGDHLHLYSARSLRDVLGQLGFGRVNVRRAGGPPGWRRLLLASACRV
jgi:ubiquinone/menaquinone biosynthesis C-methylase UbiE